MWKFGLAAGAVGLAQPDVSDMEYAKPETAKYDASGGISKVIKMLVNMKKEILAANDRDKRMYDQFACFCKEEGAARGKAIEEAKERLSELTIAINGESAVIEEATNKIKAAETEVAKQKKKQGELTGIMDRDDEDYAKRKAASVETLNVVARGIEALKKGGRNSFLQMTEQEKKAISFVESMTGKSVNEGGIGQVIGYLQELRKSTAAELQADASDNMSARTVYHKSMLLSMQMVAQQEQIIAINEEKRAKNMKMKGEDTEEYAAVKEKMDTDVAFFDNMTADCESRNKFYTQNVSDATTELSAIEAAIPELEKLVNPPQFTQVAASTEMGKLRSASDLVASKISKMSKSSRAQMMPIFAFLAQTETGKAALSATEKIVGKCEGMIKTLKSEIKETERMKATCIKTTQTLNMNQKVATKEKQVADDKVLATETAISVCEENMAENQRQIQENEKAIAYLTEQCKRIKEELVENEKQLAVEIAGVDSAIGILSDIYGAEAVEALKEHQRFKADYNDKFGKMESGKASTEKQETEFTDQKKRRQGGSAILIMLSTISDNLKKNKDDTATEIITSAKNCAKSQAELLESKLALNAVKVALETEKADLGKELVKDQAAQTEKDGLLQTANTLLSDYGNCAKRTEEYDNAISAKQIDIDGLVTVIQTLKSIASGTDDAVSVLDISPSQKAMLEIDSFNKAHGN